MPRSQHRTGPDAPKCGGGLHGLLDGRGDGGLLSWSPDAVWLVAEVPADAHLVDLDGKVKVDRCVVAMSAIRRRR